MSKLSDHGVAVDLDDWPETIWCGKIGYAAGNMGEPPAPRIRRSGAGGCRPLDTVTRKPPRVVEAFLAFDFDRLSLYRQHDDPRQRKGDAAGTRRRRLFLEKQEGVQHGER